MLHLIIIKRNTMKKESWIIENGKLICKYLTWGGKEGVKMFSLIKKELVLNQTAYYFKEDGTEYRLGHVSFCNLTLAYVALYNNTKFSSIIQNVDISVL
jgi:hypothetical protein